MTPTVVALVLNWNKAPDTIACLFSLSVQDMPHDVLVVDNGSTDDSVARISDAHPDVEILQTGTNLGYAGGNNVGLRVALQAGADYVLVLNNDVTLAPDTLGAMLRVAASTPDAGAVGGLILDATVPGTIQSAGINVGPLGDVEHRGEGHEDTGQYVAVEGADAVKGCAVLVSRKAVEAVGGLDERYFMYREEVDWCLRMRRAGYRVLVAPTARVWHAETVAGDARYTRAAYYMTRNAYLLMTAQRAPLRAYTRLLARDLVWAVNWTVNPKWRDRRQVRNAVLYGLRDAALGRWGCMSPAVVRRCGLASP